MTLKRAGWSLPILDYINLLEKKSSKKEDIGIYSNFEVKIYGFSIYQIHVVLSSLYIYICKILI